VVQPLEPLLNNAEISGDLLLCGESRKKPVGGKVSITIRLHKPIVAKQNKKVEYHLLTVLEYPPPQQPGAAPAAATAVTATSATAAPAAAAVPAVPAVPAAAVPAPAPAGGTAAGGAGGTAAGAAGGGGAGAGGVQPPEEELIDPLALDLYKSYEVMEKEKARLEALPPTPPVKERLDNLAVSTGHSPPTHSPPFTLSCTLVPPLVYASPPSRVR
jgi:hypothetical protein